MGIFRAFLHKAERQCLQGMGRFVGYLLSLLQGEREWLFICYSVVINGDFLFISVGW